MAQRRAKQGGEYGANGEWYEGGKFIANTDRPKGRKPYRQPTGRQMVAPGEYATPPEGQISIYQRYNALWMWDRDDNITMRDLPVDYWGADHLAKAADALERWKAGERWEPK